MKHKVDVCDGFSVVPATKLKVGEIGRISKGPGYPYNGMRVMKTFIGLVSLDDPSITWSSEKCNLGIVPFPRGTIVTLTVGAGDDEQG